MESHSDLRRILHYEPLIDGIDPLIADQAGTLVRASNATRTLDDGQVEIISENTARIQQMGLLVEPSRTNYVTRSVMTSGYWSGQGTVTDNFSTAPDGSNDGAKWSFNPTVSGTQARFRTLSAPSVVSGNKVRFGFYQRNATVSQSRIRITGSGGLSVLEVYNTNQGSEWAWIEFDVAVSVTGTIGAIQFEAQSDHGDGEFEIWGIDFAGEVQYMGSHVPTDGSSVTRAADDLTIPLGTVFPAEGLTVFLKLIPLGFAAGLSEQGISLGSVASTPFLNMFENYGTDTVRFEYDNGVSTVTKDHSGESFDAEVEWTAQIQGTSFKSFKGDTEQEPAGTVVNPVGITWNGSVLRIHNVAAIVKAIIVSKGARTPERMREYLRV